MNSVEAVYKAPLYYAQGEKEKGFFNHSQEDIV